MILDRNGDLILDYKQDQVLHLSGRDIDNAYDQMHAAEEVETAEEVTTENADDEDLELALQVVEAMRTDRDEVEEFVEDLGT